MNLPPDKARLLRQYDNEKKWDLICDQVGDWGGHEVVLEGRGGAVLPCRCHQHPPSPSSSPPRSGSR